MKKIKDIDKTIAKGNLERKTLEEVLNPRKIKRDKFLEGINKGESLKNIIKFKIKERNIKSTKELAYLIYEIVDTLISPISNDKDFFINYINKNIIIAINQNSKGIRKNKNKGYDNLQE